MTYRGVDATVAANELERIRQKNGGALRTNDIWRDARRPNSPLHSAFTWDVKEAAEKCWAFEARFLVRFVVVRPEKTAVEYKPLFIHVRQLPDLPAKQQVRVNYYQSRFTAAPDELSLALTQLDRLLGTVTASVEDIRTLLGGQGDPRLELLMVAKGSVDDARSALARIH